MSNTHREEVAVQRIQLITPLLDPSLDLARKTALRKHLSESSGLSERTLRRYEGAYLKTGFTGLKPKEKSATRDNALPEALVKEAILLRREVPTRSVTQIIQILEWEGKALRGQIKRSTLQDHLSKAGFNAVTMRSYTGGGLAARRFQARSRNDLWHSDIKYGPMLAIGSKGKFEQVYLVVFLDDATRYVLHAAFYDSLNHSIVKDAFKDALLHHGAPKAVYYDNGKQYRNDLIKRACAKLDIRLIYAKPYSPESTGKIERFNRNIDAFLQEVRIDKPQSLEALNKSLWTWLDMAYQHKPHSALPENQTPDMAYRSDAKPIRYIDASEIHEAFMHSEKRKVDKAGCISLNSKKYEVGIALIGQTVTIIFNPSDVREITIEAEHRPTFVAKELVIGSKVGPRPELPEHLLEVFPSVSRLLNACEIQSKAKEKQIRMAISYSSLQKEGENHV